MMPEELEEKLVTLEQLARWCVGWWESEEEVVVEVPAELLQMAVAEGWLGATRGKVRAAARDLASQAEERLLGVLLAAARRAMPMKGRVSSRRTMAGWYPGIEADRRRIGNLGHAISGAREGRWAKAGRRGELGGIGRPVPAGGEVPYAAWLAAAARELKAAKLRAGGHVRRHWQTRGRRYQEQLKKAALEGGAGVMAKTLKGQKQPHALRREVRRSDGTEARGAVDVQLAVSEHFCAAFGEGQVVQAGSLGELLADSQVGQSRRREAADGNLPEGWVGRAGRRDAAAGGRDDEAEGGGRVRATCGVAWRLAAGDHGGGVATSLGVAKAHVFGGGVGSGGRTCGWMLRRFTTRLPAACTALACACWCSPLAGAGRWSYPSRRWRERRSW